MTFSYLQFQKCFNFSGSYFISYLYPLPVNLGAAKRANKHLGTLDSCYLKQTCGEDFLEVNSSLVIEGMASSVCYVVIGSSQSLFRWGPLPSQFSVPLNGCWPRAPATSWGNPMIMTRGWLAQLAKRTIVLCHRLLGPRGGSGFFAHGRCWSFIFFPAEARAQFVCLSRFCLRLLNDCLFLFQGRLYYSDG